MIEKRRETKETAIELSLNLDGNQKVDIDTGHGFFDHLIHQLAFHARWDLTLKAKGDLHVDDHHLVEDVAIVLGQALQDGWRARPGFQRYGQRLLPMDETLILCAIDLSGRPLCKTTFEFTRETVGGLALEMVPHFFLSLAMAGAFTLHIKQMDGSNHHHIVEASFKALAHAFREALTITNQETSTKGTL